jgi:fatty acid amide hydrolase
MFSRALDRLQLDALIGPPGPLPAWTHNEFYANDSLQYTAIYNVLALPAGVLPVTRVSSEDRADDAHTARPSRDLVQRSADRILRGSEGLPVGVQVVGRWWRDDLVLAIMRVLEAEFRQRPDFPRYPPELPIA